ncbi:MAG: hypothetical protein R3248_04390 [Candidatus Promineifilaceae bacterium]|nr:hypothetical protein [Candidatus Promineifilaceae bacterium]
MDYRTLWQRTIILMLVTLLTGCAAGLAEPTATTGSPTPASDPPLLGTLTISPSGCSLDLVEDSVGPGAHAIDVVNEKGVPGVVFDMWTLLPEQTYEGFAEQIDDARVMAETESEEGLSLRSLPPPQGVERWRRFGVDGRSETIYKYLTPGTYAIVCQEFIDPAGWWPMYIVGPIEVE